MLANKLPFWRGFNLPTGGLATEAQPFAEEDFALIAEWGFNWVRLPLAYISWIRDGDPKALQEPVLKKIDRAVELGKQYGIHLNIAFHRAPGYCCSRGRNEPFNLWKDVAAVEACTFHWQHFTQRYAGVPGEQLSFNLWNEPGFPDPKVMTPQDHDRVARHVVAAVRTIDPNRPIILDGLRYGVTALEELADLPVGQSCRGYYPLQITHHKATWVHEPVTQEPAWPIRVDGVLIDRAKLEEFYAPWVALIAKGVGVHCGEMGVLNTTPHPIAMAWLRDLLSVLAERNIGYAPWNLRGHFGVLDSERPDVVYESFRGHKLDRAMLHLLQHPAASA